MDKQVFPPLQPKVVLGIAAHPDDLDFGAAATMAKFAREGANVHYLILTDGSKGSADENMTTKELVAVRQKEQQKALEMVGGKSVQFLDHVDGELEVTMDLKKEITRVIRNLKPDLVITWDPSMIYSARSGFINHPDHRAAGQAALDATFPLARDHLAMPELYAEGLKPHITPTILLINFDTSNYCIDITDTFEQKMDAIHAHQSQVPDKEDTRDWIEKIARAAGKDNGCTLAEAYIRVDIR